MKTISLYALFLALPAVWGDTLTHDYNLTGSLNDLVGSIALTSDGGSVTAAGYTFGVDQGLNVSSALSDTGNYSILMDFSFQDLNGYRKILDYKDLASDNGVYNLNTDLNYFNFSFGPGGSFTANTLARVIITRDSTSGVVTGYVDGCPRSASRIKIAQAMQCSAPPTVSCGSLRTTTSQASAKRGDGLVALSASTTEP